jgi:hypothetical protein
MMVSEPPSSMLRADPSLITSIAECFGSMASQTGHLPSAQLAQLA